MKRALVLLVLAGCSKLIGIADLGGPGDAAIGSDATDDAKVTPIKVTGHVKRIDGTALAGKVHLVNAAGNELAGGDTDSDGGYALQVMRTGVIDVQVKVDGLAAGLREAVSYFAAPLDADAVAEVMVFADSELQMLCSLTGETYATAMGMLYVTVDNGDGKPVSGATVKVAGAYDDLLYSDNTGQLVHNTETGADGVGYVFGPSANRHQVDTLSFATRSRIVVTEAATDTYLELRP